MLFEVEPKLARDVDNLEGNFKVYQKLKGRTYRLINCGGTFEFLHIQGSPDAYPASVIDVKIPFKHFGVDPKRVSDPVYRLGVSDYIARMLTEGIKQKTTPSKGLGSSGSFQPPELPQQIVLRNIVGFDIKDEMVSLWIRVSLAGDNASIDRDFTKKMLTMELPEILCYIKSQTMDNQGRLHKRFTKHIQSVVTYYEILEKLESEGYVAFIGNGSILPRESGISDLPLKNAIPFRSAPSLEKKFVLSDGREIKGMVIPKGITVIVGGGFHGKSTLLNALIKGLYPHVPGDGRELVVTQRNTVKLKSEDGRSVKGVDISGFIRSLPGGKNPRCFYTSCASGSTSEASSLVEFATQGVKTFLFDEDDSATNFLIKDPIMRKLITEDPIIPLFDRANELKENWKINLVIIAGGSSMYLKIADTVIKMKNFLPINVTKTAKRLATSEPEEPDSPLELKDDRIVDKDNFNPKFTAHRFGKKISVRIKVLRREPRKLEYGNDLIDLSAIDTLVDSDQLVTIGMIFYALRENGDLKGGLRVTELIEKAQHILRTKGLRELAGKNALYLAYPRKEEIIAALNRIRSLKLKKI